MDPDSAERLLDALLGPEEDLASAVECKPSPPPTIPGYEVERLIGEGAAGRVWLGRRAGSDRPAAIKILRDRLDGGNGGKRAWRELALLEDLRLPSIPRLIDYGTLDDRMYIVTEYVRGVRIDEHTDRAGLDTRSRVGLLVRLSRAVGALHDRGVIHRDLKPSNVLVTEAGEPMIIDLGIAAARTDEKMETLTAEGAALGTPAYMAPEQARGERQGVGTRSDIYALGAIAYLLLTGRTPHDIDDLTLLESIRVVGQAPPRRPREIEPGLPRALDAVLLKACDADSSRRYASAGEFADDLERWLRAEPVLAGTQTPWQRASRWIGGHPVLTSAAAAATLIASSVLISLGFTWYTLHRPAAAEVVDDSSAVVLRSSSGHHVRRWECPEGMTIECAQRVRLPGRRGFHVAVSCSEITSTNLNNSIAVYDGLRDLVWSKTDAELAFSIPPDILAVQSGRYLDELVRDDGSMPAAARFIAADIFETSPGEELAVLFKHAHLSPCCIRVVSGLDGTTLSEVWHDGDLNHIQWLPGSGLLVCYGPANALWNAGEAPFAGETDPAYTSAVFAFRPEHGRIHNRSITSPDIGGDTAAAWFMAFSDPRWLRLNENTGLNNSGHPRSTDLTLELQFGREPDPEDNVGVQVVVAPDGSVNGFVPSDAWRATFPGAPIPERLADIGLVNVTGYDPANGRLGDWPPKPRTPDP